MIELIEETNDYWFILEEEGLKTLIFKPNYNDNLEKYFDILSNSNKLIFSNHNELTHSIRYFNTKIKSMSFSNSQFNKPIMLKEFDNLKYLYLGYNHNENIELPLGLIHLNLGAKFNRKINLNLSKNLKHFITGTFFNSVLNISLLNDLEKLEFGYMFNKKIIFSNPNLSLKYFSMGYSFNIPIEFENFKNLTYLVIGKKFNQKINLPNSITHLTFDNNNSINIFDNLDNNIIELELGKHFDMTLNNLPNSIKNLIFDKSSRYDKEINGLIDTIEYIELPKYYNKKILNIPKNLKKIKLSTKYKFINNFIEKFSDVEVHTY